MAKIKSLSAAEYLKEMADETNIKVQDIRLVVTSLQKVLAKELATTGEVRLFDIGKFKLVTTKPRTGINPKTKQKIQIPAGKKIKLTVSKILTDAVDSHK
ncbi:histone-like DNA-binding superfamily protein [Mycoplasmoides gallisepticum S6]|uniref:Histone-like DNA-binding superfamily protein n=1 Tax=Mycoplasmoides gallisepticum S6 TaxID=1006581 RepID=A0A0F6CKR5_MYCGL|nr:HU family DNA-binding protein [Mycoplasmoides gallisepticum]AHB99687.1 histone-like DNA-binding superfamily protein [Mycoplasmoides gallisepticum S6]2NDP_A Chain A, Histone-like DNA-binding superfamily protein [Mycoplasmoides gallisepticum S6]2NDP_B Chain B, Histone-like DNA-binding superfamily protein [Mycoplasmoides gallisepticum S6]